MRFFKIVVLLIGAAHFGSSAFASRMPRSNLGALTGLEAVTVGTSVSGYHGMGDNALLLMDEISDGFALSLRRDGIEVLGFPAEKYFLVCDVFFAASASTNFTGILNVELYDVQSDHSVYILLYEASYWHRNIPTSMGGIGMKIGEWCGDTFARSFYRANSKTDE